MGLLEDAIKGGDFQQARQLSSFFADMPQRQIGGERGLPAGAVSDPRAPAGYTIADPHQLEAANRAEQQFARAYAMDQFLQRQRAQQQKALTDVLKQIRDPDLQAEVLKRLGFGSIQPGKAKLTREKELASFKSSLEAPERAERLDIQREGVRGQLAQRREQQSGQLGIQQQLADLKGQQVENQRAAIIDRLTQASERAKMIDPDLARAINMKIMQLLISGGGIKVTRE